MYPAPDYAQSLRYQVKRSRRFGRCRSNEAAHIVRREPARSALDLLVGCARDDEHFTRQRTFVFSAIYRIKIFDNADPSDSIGKFYSVGMNCFLSNGVACDASAKQWK